MAKTLTLPDKPILDDGTMTVLNPATHDRKCVLIFKEGDEKNPTYRRENITFKGALVNGGRTSLDAHQYEALRRSCGQLEPEVFHRPTMSIFAAIGGLQVLADELKALLDGVKAGTVDYGKINNQRDAVAIARTVRWTEEEVEEELLAEDKDREFKEGEVRGIVNARNTELVNRLYDQSVFGPAKEVIKRRLPPQRKFELGLIDEPTFKALNDQANASRIAVNETDNFVDKVLNGNLDAARAHIERAGTGNFGALKEIYNRDKRKGVHDAIEELLIGKRIPSAWDVEAGGDEVVTPDNVKELLKG